MNTGFFDLQLELYRHIYRQKPSAFAGAGDGLGLTGGCSSASIVNYRRPIERAISDRIPYENDHKPSLYGLLLAARHLPSRRCTLEPYARYVESCFLARFTTTVGATARWYLGISRRAPPTRGLPWLCTRAI